jgi:hypothetical protein
MSVLKKLTEGIVRRDVSKEGAALLNKWEKTGLLEGLSNDTHKNNMAVLLENQAKELLREASSMAAGDVEGFASVAFPIVRRVFGGLIANDLVSVQPMSLPSGLIFFLDFTHSDARGAGSAAGDSLYGGNVVGRQVTGGVDLNPAPDATNAVGASAGPGGFYNLGTGYTSATGSLALADAAGNNPGTVVGAARLHDVSSWTTADCPLGAAGVKVSALTQAQKEVIRFDPDILSRPDDYVGTFVIRLTDAVSKLIDFGALTAMHVGDDGTAGVPAAFTGAGTTGTGAQIVRRLTRNGYLNASGDEVKASKGNHLMVVVQATDTFDGDIGATLQQLIYPVRDNLVNTDHVGAVSGAQEWGLEGAGDGSIKGMKPSKIPEIDIKVDSIAVTAETKKLKAKWTPELGQDLNAYHNLDAEVELTGILSEQIALEIDQEILGDLIQGAAAGTRFWSRAPGLFVNSKGTELGAASAAPDFTGTVSEWYETLIETINDVSAQIHRKTLRGGANFVVCSPEVANILEFTSGFRASVTADADKGDIGAVKVGALSKKFEVFVDPYFPRNVVLIGRKGGSFLESGYVYAPYVPLQVTPTIFGTEDFVPRKGVMTRYAKKMVRPDMYGLVIVRGLLGEEGSS